MVGIFVDVLSEFYCEVELVVIRVKQRYEELFDIDTGDVPHQKLQDVRREDVPQ